MSPERFPGIGLDYSYLSVPEDIVYLAHTGSGLGILNTVTWNIHCIPAKVEFDGKPFIELTLERQLEVQEFIAKNQ